MAVVPSCSPNMYYSRDRPENMFKEFGIDCHIDYGMQQVVLKYKGINRCVDLGQIEECRDEKLFYYIADQMRNEYEASQRQQSMMNTVPLGYITAGTKITQENITSAIQVNPPAPKQTPNLILLLTENDL